MSQAVTLKTPIRYLKGVGPERSRIFSKLDLETLEDLFYLFPRRYENRFPIKKISELTLEDKECVEGIVSSRSLFRTKYGQSIFRVVLSEGKNVFYASWFNQPYLSKVFLPKTRVVFYGKAEKEGQRIQMVHPEYEIVRDAQETERVHSGRVVPIYPLTEELTQKNLRTLLFNLVKDFSWLQKELFPDLFRKRLKLPGALYAFQQIHFPDSFEDLEKAYRRLVFNEFFLLQILVQLRRMELQKENKLITHATGEEKIKELLGVFGFKPTLGQEKAIQDIIIDMKKTRPMNRLVQGDVGSGKTLVAAAGLVFTAANGFQGALMAPTEVLAQQHYFTLMQALEPLGIRCAYLAQGILKEDREQILQGLLSGEIQVVVGTHALIQKDVKFKQLGLAVIDEQHKFGIFQRAALKDKSGSSTHFLLMTATPIPRTLAMTLYGDLDISTMGELPKGRKPITTMWVGEERRREIYGLLKAELEKGRQGYVICPFIENGKSLSIKDVLTAHKELAAVFADKKVGFLHGGMKAAEKKEVMQSFKKGEIHILVSTVVIEVGIDVPNATVMIIENAEKFGLAQLHQLRGRVGRGSEESICILFSNTTNEESAERLASFEKMQSGFEIAEKDLELRGAGDIVGEKQHGLPQLRIGDLVKDIKILEEARREAKAIVEKDPRLALPEHRALKRAIQERFKATDAKLTVLA